VFGVARDHEGVGPRGAHDSYQVHGEAVRRALGWTLRTRPSASEPKVDVGDDERSGASAVFRLEEKCGGTGDRDQSDVHTPPDPSRAKRLRVARIRTTRDAGFELVAPRPDSKRAQPRVFERSRHTSLYTSGK
jgi:hypothetical protein